MTQKRPPSETQDSPRHIEVEEWRWQMPTSSKVTWKYWLAAALFMILTLLFAFGFLLIAGIALAFGLVISLLLFFLRRLP